jgi:mRNA interferase MazF
MRTIHLARLDKTRPALLLTREIAVPHLKWVTVAPITSRIRGIRVEVPVGPANGIDHEAVANLDNVITIPATELGRRIGRLLDAQERLLTEAIRAAFDLV